MRPKILVACFETPGWGGAATLAYLLYERMQRDGLAKGYVNLVERADESFLQETFGSNYGNPKNLPQVHTNILEPPLWRAHASLANTISRLKPTLLVGVDFIATRLLQLAAPSLPVAMITAGACQLMHLIELGPIKDFMQFCRAVESGLVFPMPNQHPERQAVENATLVILHSPLVKAAFDHFVPSAANRIHPRAISIADLVFTEAESFVDMQQPWDKRDIDVLFVASNWNRPVKNYPLVKDIVRATQGMKIDIVGKYEQPCERARHHGMVASRKEMYELFSRTKALVCPSTVDAAPGVLFEAAAMGCNVVASKNCGNWELCNEQLLAESCAVGPFVNKMKLAQVGPYSDHRDKFRGGYQELITILETL